MTRKWTELPQIDQLSSFLYVRNPQKSHSLSCHILPAILPGQLVTQEAGAWGLSSVFFLPTECLGLQGQLGLPGPRGGHLEPWYPIWWGQWPIYFLVSQGHPDGFQSDFIKCPGPAGLLLACNGKGFKPTMALKALQLPGWHLLSVDLFLTLLCTFWVWSKSCILCLPRPRLQVPSLHCRKYESYSVWRDQKGRPYVPAPSYLSSWGVLW